MTYREDLKEARKEVSRKVSELELNFERCTKLLPIAEEWDDYADGVEIKEITVNNYEHSTIAIIHGKEGACIKPHFHRQMELIHVISGTCEETESKKVITLGDYISIPSRQMHGIKFISDSIIIVQWKPKLKRL